MTMGGVPGLSGNMKAIPTHVKSGIIDAVKNLNISEITDCYSLEKRKKQRL